MDYRRINGLENSTFIYFAAEGDEKAYKGQNEVKEYLTNKSIKFG